MSLFNILTTTCPGHRCGLLPKIRHVGVRPTEVAAMCSVSHCIAVSITALTATMAKKFSGGGHAMYCGRIWLQLVRQFMPEMAHAISRLDGGTKSRAP